MQPEDVGVIAEVIASQLAPLQKRIAELEARQPERGADGKDGRDGVDGAEGPAGPQGERGERGEKGDIGERGERGEVGPTGDTGLAGKDGRDGKDGKDGIIGKDGDVGPVGPPGPQGVAGRDGMPGVPGRTGEAGKDGVDGLGFDDIQTEYDGERSFSFSFIRGTQKKTFGAFVAPIPIFRGAYEEGRTYEMHDCVQFGGNVWQAKEQTSVKPDEHTLDGRRAWRLMVRRGRDGKQGPAGPKWSSSHA